MPKFILLTRHTATDADLPPMTEWDPADAAKHMERLIAINNALAENGELVEALALASPELAKVVTAGATSTPVITDGPFPEAKEMLAGYQMIDVESEERALEIAAMVSSAPGPGGVPIAQPIEVRRIMGGVGQDL
ncbi:YciI family protein [Actinomycetes bacterium KLBMP 9759]